MFHRFHKFLTLPEANRTFSLQKRVKEFQRSTETKFRVHGLTSLGRPINNYSVIDIQLQFTTIIQDFAKKSQENV